MKKFLSIIVNILILTALLLLPSVLLTKKRIIIIENQPRANQLSASSNLITKNAPFLSRTILLSDENERINSIFLGIPGQNNDAPNLTDTLMIMSVNKNTNDGFLLSIPRDLLVKIPETNFYTKINNLYQENGIDSIQTVLSEITGLSFDYNIVIDLEGVKQIINEVGGIDIFIEKEIYDPAFPGQNNSYQLFTLGKGWQHLDGISALKYIRTRYGAGSDFARMGRQQKILIALKEKIASLHPLRNLTIISNIWQAFNNHFQTNLSLQNIKTFLELARNVDLEKIEFKVLDPTTELLVSDYFTLGGQRAYILRPKAGIGNYNEIQEYINNLMQI